MWALFPVAHSISRSCGFRTGLPVMRQTAAFHSREAVVLVQANQLSLEEKVWRILQPLFVAFKCQVPIEIAMTLTVPNAEVGDAERAGCGEKHHSEQPLQPHHRAVGLARLGQLRQGKTCRFACSEITIVIIYIEQ